MKTKEVFQLVYSTCFFWFFFKYDISHVALHDDVLCGHLLL